ncbi:hypothetical protein BD309DRAFT_974840 [Dichomitus squalens]|uniref:Uncharacterized protein n=1 Tax=Dichomitus squalens TaxID=114155 RepID=A0A4V2K9J9_9APHY|nr:hypothetical protein BD309DRAFT_974840 [Dichomitus squalens]TBU64188.1 hypothetical protein BD310DRAFT_471152 [Dichomitus squalens]
MASPRPRPRKPGGAPSVRMSSPATAHAGHVGLVALAYGARARVGSPMGSSARLRPQASGLSPEALRSSPPGGRRPGLSLGTVAPRLGASREFGHATGSDPPVFRAGRPVVARVQEACRPYAPKDALREMLEFRGVGEA